MKWFKHHCDLSRDEGASVYLEQAGKDSLTAYGFLLRILEVIGEKMSANEGDRHCSAEYSQKGWSKVLDCHVHRVQKYMELLPHIPWVSVEFDDSKYRVTVPKMWEWRDETTRKSGKGPEHVAQNRPEQKRPEQRESNAALSGGQAERVPVDRSQQDFVLTPDRRAWAEANRPDIDIDFETKKFRVYDFKRPLSNLEAAWKKWILDARSTLPNRASGTIVNDSRRQLLEMGLLLGISQGPDEPEDTYLARVKQANDKRIASMDS